MSNDEEIAVPGRPARGVGKQAFALTGFYAQASPTNKDLIVIWAANGRAHSVASVVTLDTLSDLFERRTISQVDARRVVSAEIDKFGEVISAKFENDPSAFTKDPNSSSLLRCDLTLRDLKVGGQTYSASVLDAPATGPLGPDGIF